MALECAFILSSQIELKWFKTIKKRAQLGVEPRTTRTRSEYHTTRPLSQLEYIINDLKSPRISYLACVDYIEIKFSARHGA